MPTKAETHITNRIIKALNSLPMTWCMKVHGGAFQTAGVPDIIGVKYGRFFGIEVKVPGGKATKLQELMLSRLHACGALTGIATCVDEALSIIGEE